MLLPRCRKVVSVYTILIPESPRNSHSPSPSPGHRGRGEESIIDIYLQADDLHLLAGQGGLQVGQVTPQATDDEIFLGQGGIPFRLQIHNRDTQQLVKIV